MIVKIDKLSHDFRGITKVNDKVTFVEGALPTETVDIRIIKEKKNYNDAKIISYIEESSDRVNYQCPFYDKCGACDIGYIDYNKGIEYKKNNFIDIMKRYANIDINPDIILTDGYEYDMVNKLLDKYPNCISVLDAEKNNDDVINLAKRVTYVVASKSFLEKFSNIKIDNDDKFDEAIKIANKHFNNLIVTLEDKGCIYNGKIIPSIKVKAIDSTGAGDIFHGAFVYGLSQKWDIEKCLRFANTAGSLSVTKYGGRNSIFELNEVEEVFNETK